jgi:hypothetical protein
MCGSFDGGDAPMQRLVTALAVLPLLLIASAGFAEDEDEEPGVFVGYLRNTGNIFVGGFNGILTFPADPVAFTIEGDEVFSELPKPSVTGRLLGFPAGLFQGIYRLMMGVCDVALAVVPAMPMLSPVPRYELLPFEHEDE